MEEKGFVGKMKVFSMVPRAAAAAKRAESSVPDGRRVLANKGSDQLQLRARVAQEVRGRGRDIKEYFSETPHLALVKAVSAHAARLVAQCDTVAAVFDVRRAYLYAEEKRSTFVEAPDYLCADLRASQEGKLRKAQYGSRPAAVSWGDELFKRAHQLWDRCGDCVPLLLP